MPELRVEGQQKLHELYKELKRVGDTELQKSLTKAIRESTKPMKDAIKASALERLPKRGGLAQLIANSKVTNAVKKGARNAGVTIKAVNEHEIKAMNNGRLRHLVFGRRGKWVTQAVPKGWFSDPIDKHAPEIQKAVNQAVKDIADQFNSHGSSARNAEFSNGSRSHGNSGG